MRHIAKVSFLTIAFIAFGNFIQAQEPTIKSIMIVEVVVTAQ